MLLSLFANIVTSPYSLVLWLRHKCYDWGILRSIAVDITVISIGNITVGGTGKTPHTELLVRLFSQEVPMAVLSRGYKRTSKGFRYVYCSDSILDVGDEPFQIKRKFPSVVVAVDTNRTAGIKQIVKDHPHIKLFVLDDAFQYRRLKPKYSILLSDYHRPFTQDRLLPLGRLRDLPSRASQAHIMIVTKTPRQISSSERERQKKLLKPNPNQQLMFTCYSYGASYPIFPKVTHALNQSVGNEHIALTGIAQPKPFLNWISASGTIVQHLKFPDHHHFTKKNIRQINELATKYPNAAIFTTEKDAVRLMEASFLSAEAKAKMYCIPIEVDFCAIEERCQFTKIIRALWI